MGDLIYDPNIYDSLNTQMDDLKFNTKWLPNKEKSSILELCCGTGRLTIPITEKGYKISGLDITNSMLEKAKAKAKTLKLDIEFIEGDARDFELYKKFDLIFVPFNSIHHLYKNEDLFALFKAVKKHLKPNGLFLFDCYNPNIHYIAEAEKKSQNITDYRAQDGRRIQIQQQMQYESDTQINRIQWDYHIDGQFNSSENLDMRMYYPQELNTYLTWHKFEILKKFGNFEESPFHSKSEKQIYVCK